MPKDERTRVSQAQEKAAAKRLGGRVVPGSGAGWARKGDVRTDNELVENKTVLRGNTQITIKALALKKIETEAVAEGRQALLHFRIGGRNYIVLREHDYDELRMMAYGSAQDLDKGTT